LVLHDPSAMSLSVHISPAEGVYLSAPWAIGTTNTNEILKPLET